jgi:3-keto-5-aminohexanoate cleavage enzyme
VDRDAAVIEVGLNEGAMRAQARHVAYSPGECARDAAACAGAGAAIVHWHARDAGSGAQRLGATGLYAEALAGMHDSGVLAYPTYPIDVDTVDGRLGHCFALRRDHGLEIVPLDLGSVSVVIWDQATRSFPYPDIDPGVVTNPLSFTLGALDRSRELGLVPTFGVFDLGGTRTLALLAEAGRLQEPVMVKFFLSGSWAVGPFPTEAALDFHLSQLPDGLDVEWIAVPYSIDDPALIERLCRHALERGGGVRVGLGDNPLADPDATNAEWVDRAVGWAGAAGRPVASSDDVRRRIGVG